MNLLIILLSPFMILFLCLSPVNAQEDPLEPPIEKRDKSLSFETWEPGIEIKPSFFDKIKSNISMNGFFKQEVAYRYVRPTTLTKILNIFQLESNYSISPNIGLYTRIYSFYDGIYDVVDPDVVSPRKGPEVILTTAPTPEEILGVDISNIRQLEKDNRGIQFKEIFFDLHFKLMDFRIGRQIIRWGVVEGSRVTDEINPLDLKEFILRDINDRYIPLWILKADYFLGDNTLEFIWIPEIRGHKPAPKETEWEQFRILPGTIKPANNLKNSEIAFKISRQLFGWEVSASYFYTWDDFPAAFRTVRDSGLFGTSPDVVITPLYDRLQILGVTFSKSFGKIILNSEAAYVIGKLFGSSFGKIIGEAPLVNSGEVSKNYLKYAVGFDYTLFGIDTSTQFIQQYILKYEEIIIQDVDDTILSLFSRKELLDNKLVPQILVIYFINNTEILTRPKIEYAITENIKVAIGADILNGHIIKSKSPGDFNFVGFFRNNDRVYFEVKYSF